MLKACEHRGYREAAQPRGVALPLKRYQAQALAWMQDMEELPRGINGLFWEERAFGDGGTYYFSPQLGEMRLEAPPLRERAPRVEHDGRHRERRAAELLPIQVRAEHDVGPEQQAGHLELAEDLVRQRAQAADDHVARRRRPRAEHLRSVSR